ncbi:MAG: hypothetical protein PUD10_05635, partial [Lachnospira sp.]|nr:hypothetical protein [Lachnospira sp.]
MKERKSNKARNKNISLYVGTFNLIMLILFTMHFAYNLNHYNNAMLREQIHGKVNTLIVFTMFFLVFISVKMWGGFKLGYI